MIALPPLLVGALSTGALVCLLLHRRANVGSRSVLVFAASALGYGVVRSNMIEWISRSIGSDGPYRIATPMASFAGVPVQELIGWLIAVALASYLADRLLTFARRPTDSWSVALVGGCVMAAICLVVETAAVSGSWWTWTLAHGKDDTLLFPTIALVDWAFVAIDFLLPFELWRRNTALWERIVGLLLFPIHFAGHLLTGPGPRLLPFSGFEITHIALIAFVAAMALRSQDLSSLWPSSSAEAMKPAFLAGAWIVIATASVQIVLASEASRLWTAVPLSLMSIAALVVPPRIQVETRAPVSTPRAVWVFIAILGTGLFLRLPDALRARDFGARVQRGLAQLSAGQTDGARTELLAALKNRPNHPEVLWLLGWIEMKAGNPVIARDHLETAVRLRLASIDAVRTLALLDLMEGRRDDARALLARRRARFPETEDLTYLAWRADRPELQSAQGLESGLQAAPVIANASPAAAARIFPLAQALGDAATMKACEARARMTAPTERP